MSESPSDLPDMTEGAFSLNSAFGPAPPSGPPTPGGGPIIGVDVATTNNSRTDEVEEITVDNVNLQRPNNLGPQFDYARRAVLEGMVQERTASWSMFSLNAILQDQRLDLYNAIVETHGTQQPYLFAQHLPSFYGNMLPQSEVSVADFAWHCTTCMESINNNHIYTLWVHAVCDHINTQGIFCHNCTAFFEPASEHPRLWTMLNEFGLTFTEGLLQARENAEERFYEGPPLSPSPELLSSSNVSASPNVSNAPGSPNLSNVPGSPNPSNTSNSSGSNSSILSNEGVQRVFREALRSEDDVRRFQEYYRDFIVRMNALPRRSFPGTANPLNELASPDTPDSSDAPTSHKRRFSDIDSGSDRPNKRRKIS